MNLLQRPKANSAFSLVELLVVIAIIGFLAALLLTAISQASGKARRIQCANNIRQLGLALQQFVGENHFFPLKINGDIYKGGYSDHGFGWQDALTQQLSLNLNKSNWQSSIWFCPGAAHPSSVPKEYPFPSYGYNACGLAVMKDVDALGLGGHHGMGNLRADKKVIFAPPVAETEIANPSDMMAVGDGFIGNDVSVQDGTSFFWRTMTGDFFGSTKRSYARHQGRANVVFCDGHVESPTLDFLFKDTSDAALVRWNRDHLPHREKL